MDNDMGNIEESRHHLVIGLQPALTAEEWARKAVDRGRQPEGYSFGYTSLEPADASAGWPELLYVDSEEGFAPRHATAALALYGQPFGFTREMVDALQSLIDDYVPVQSREAELADAAIARLRALLPPE